MSAFGGKADKLLRGSPLWRSLLGAKRTSNLAPHTSAGDPKRTWRRVIKPLPLGEPESVRCCPERRGLQM